MTTPNAFPDPEPGLDALVRAQLEAEAGKANVRSMADRVLARLAADAPARPRRGRPWSRVAALAGAAALAATVLVALFVSSGPRDAVASPADVVQAARDSAAGNDTRCYRVTLELPAPARELFPLLALDSGTRTLCTRGAQFVVEPGFGGRGAWGRDGTGRVWVAPTPEAAAAFSEAELPPGLRNAVKIHALELPPVLNEVLIDFDLTWAEPPTPTADAHAVTATRRGEPPLLGIAGAELVIEKNTNVIRSLTVRRKALFNGTTTLTFALLSSVARADTVFTPEGHINPGAPVYDRSQPVLRRQAMRWTDMKPPQER
ncbi:hypothetical protein [Frigoriglobus tundricola]|uniref:Uncharacterized protein n=1 Tax=Frigoriglobus tundricola TaxID=2774151 RepID=A0A6M5Z1G6_9BACT|nr:hypothetical protein [Frigoriglobus tundricola]QJW99022.1 hypothetical protein FTUN_6618 [Frigoriglobus tundricola]